MERPQVEREISNLDDFEDVLDRIGPDAPGLARRGCGDVPHPAGADHRHDGEILAEPLFWFQLDDRIVACFAKEEPGPHTLHKLEDSKIEVIRPGQNLPE